MQWITRERPKIDRIANETGAIPYDIPGVELTHVGELCSFDAFLNKYQLGGNPALQHLASIVRGADTSRLELTPQSSGLYAISLGLSHVFADDLAMLEHGLVMYDALYAWCEHCQAETHNWPPKMPA
ncbi:chromate resistance protein ChrB domain-containing protein [Ralstonia sp. R-29]|uniref:chromate resistance protein ChrB domain-containing protein n=1 Tax=Ralstonia sp. R-29 TaxID=3404059 RepID=UPI003CF7F311